MERLGIPFHGITNALVVRAYTSVEGWVEGWMTRETSRGHQALQRTFAHQWAP